MKNRDTTRRTRRLLRGLVAGGWLVCGAAACAHAPVSAAGESPPNVVLILADDLGYAELGSYGQEKIRTPRLDRLAAEGMRFTQFYSGSPVCAPSRATLMTGLHTGHSPVRGNLRIGYPLEDGRTEEGNAPLPAGTQTIATMLQARGYATAAVGKWGLGGPGSTGLPVQHGFDLFYGYLDQRHAHNFYPAYLWTGTAQGMRWDSLRNRPFPAHQALEGDPDDPASYERFKGTDYAPDLATAHALEFIRSHRHRPFFLYVATPLPHVALQVPDEELERYSFPETPYTGDDGYLPHPRPRAAYAGMISRMDRNVGEILDLLSELGLEENTLVIFTSDNGTTYNGGVDPVFFNSVGPLRGLKNSVYEGGIRVPMIARWPGRIDPGSITDHVGANWDLLPTLAELAGTATPRGIDGISFLQILLGRASGQKEHAYLYWENHGPCEGQQAVRAGRWKAVRSGVHAERPGAIELYDLSVDVGETRDVAAEHPEVVRRLELVMREAHEPSPVARWNITADWATEPAATDRRCRHPSLGIAAG